MNEYEPLIMLESCGSNSVVIKAQHGTTKEFVAVKKYRRRFETIEELKRLPEIRVLCRIKRHPNVVHLREVRRERGTAYLVYEYVDDTLSTVLQRRCREFVKQQREAASTPASNPPGVAAFDEREIRSIFAQTLLGIQAIHKSGFMHRDLKPAHLLLTKGNDPVVKVAGLSVAKEIRSRPPISTYVTARWYWAPELVLESDRYSSPVDIWAIATIVAELYTFTPLFSGASQSDQLFKICSVLGAPTVAEWDEGHQLARRLNLRFSNISPTPLRQLLANTGASPAALDLLESMLRFNPGDRPTATQCLEHPFFAGKDGDNASSR